MTYSQGNAYSCEGDVQTAVLPQSMNTIKTERPKLSITLVHHAGLSALHDCLQSLENNPPEVSFEIILVDNASTDGAIEMVRKEFPQVRLLQNERRQGFGSNQNRAIEASEGDYILLLNDDTVVYPHALDGLCHFMDSHPDIGVVGPRLLNPDGSLQQSCYRFPSPLRSLTENLLLTAVFPEHPVLGDYRRWPHNSEREVDFVVGAAMLVRRQIIETVGTLDTDFFMYFEEIDWQRRITQAGWRVGFCPDAVITHLGGQSSEGRRGRQLVEFNRGHLRYMRKHYGNTGAILHRILMIVGALLRLSLWNLLALVKTACRQEARQNLAIWKHHLRWWTGLSSEPGLSELAESPHG